MSDRFFRLPAFAKYAPFGTVGRGRRTASVIRIAAPASVSARALPLWAEGVWKLVRFLDEEDVPVDFVEAPGFWTIVAPYSPEGAESALSLPLLWCDLS